VNPQALIKTWRKSSGNIPHMMPRQYEQLLALSTYYYTGSTKFWGIVDRLAKHQGRNLIYCFNFGNLTVKFPWQAEALNFGQRVPVQIAGSGTARAVRTMRTLLHQVESPFLYFVLGDDSSHAEERLQSGCVLADKGEGQLVTQREVLLLPGSGPAPREGIIYYFLIKRLTFCAEVLEPVPSPITGELLERMRIQVHDGLLLEPGWTLLILEKDRYFWGVVRE
jgi:hypothetical protein